MALPSPHLDDRRFQDLLDDAVRLVQQQCPEWTDHHASDPGMVLLEAFAHMADQIIYRLNQIPEKVHLEFLDLVGIRLTPPQSASAELTFWLVAPAESPVSVPSGTEVAAERFATETDCVFTVEHDLDMVPVAVSYVAVAGPGRALVLVTEELAGGNVVNCFADHPGEGDVFLIGLTQPAPRCVVSLEMDCPTGGIGVNPSCPPLVWEAWAGETWEACEVLTDTTGGLSSSGKVLLLLPASHQPSLIGRRIAGWLRCRVLPNREGRPQYAESPRVGRVEASTVGGSTWARHGRIVHHEELGTSDGTAGQTFRLEKAPIVAESLNEVIVGTGEDGELWTRVTSFADSVTTDRHFTVDEVSGEVHFGPTVRAADGSVRRYGAVPASGSRVIARRFRLGGGRWGNVAAGSLTMLRSPVPSVTSVENRRSAAGGLDAENLDNLKLRAARLLSTQRRVVTASDYITTVLAGCPRAGRVECLESMPPGPRGHGVVRVLVVPHHEYGLLQTEWQAAIPDATMLDDIARIIDAKRPLGTRVVVSGPDYRGLTVIAEVSPEPDAAPHRLREDVLDAVYSFFSPLTGPSGGGWPLGRTVRVTELHAVVAAVAGVEAIENLHMFQADLETGERSGPMPRLKLEPTMLPLSFQHQVAVTGRPHKREEGDRP